LPLDQATPAKTFETAALEAAHEATAQMKDLVDGEPILRYTSISPTGAGLQLSVRITDFARGAELKHEILDRMYAKLHTASSPAAPSPAAPSPAAQVPGTN
ncbi:MAG: hypothetical protein ACYDBH_20510, partial [Acidobacteriaceae bacterium]